jgi:hypothetical protein
MSMASGPHVKRSALQADASATGMEQKAHDTGDNQIGGQSTGGELDGDALQFWQTQETREGKAAR